MKYKIGDKVRYDGGDWWFYGTVSAVFEHSLCPCYRFNVERMERKNSKLSITQFEFELEACEEIDRSKDLRKWENSEIEYLKKYYGVLSLDDLSKVLKRSTQALEDKWRMIKQEPEPEPKPEKKPKLKLEPEQKTEPEPEKLELTPTQPEEPKKRKRGDAWDRNLELFCKGERNNVIYTWVTYNRRLYKTNKLKEEQFNKLMEINFPFDVDKKGRPKKTEKTDLTQTKEPSKRRKGEAWDVNFESYSKGEKSNVISTWIAQNRNLYKTGNLPEEKYVKLKEINFPFEVVKKNPDGWDRQLEEWKKGNRKSIPIQQWRQRSIRQFVEGKLTVDRIVKLKEVGILK